MTVINEQCAANGDDSWENGAGASFHNAATAWLVGAVYSAARFTPAVAQAAVIESATLSLYLAEAGSYDDPDLDIFGDDEDNMAQFDGTANEISNLTQTTATTAVSDSNLGIGWQEYDVTAIVQEIVDRGAWVSENGMGIILEGNAAGSMKHSLYSGGAPTLAPKLEINYHTEAPTERKFTIPAETRTFTIPAETRTYTVPAAS